MNRSKSIRLDRAAESEAEELASISKRAFHSDKDVGASGEGGPIGYDSPSFQQRMMKFLEYYKILQDDTITGGIIVSPRKKLYRILERIFVDPLHQNKGFGSQAMELLWQTYPKVQLWTLGTPEWNVRTKHFYEKLGFIQVGWTKEDGRGRYYQKVMDSSNPYEMRKIRDLEDGMKYVTVEGVILSKSEPKSVKSRSTGKALTVANAELEDMTGKIVLILWNEQISQVEVDDKVRVEFGSIKSYMGTNQLSVSWGGHLITLI
jgi:GNAT superfamily N-acetyltransferase